MKHKQQIFIFDTTLRDGQQSPGAGMSFADNLRYAEHAHELGIDVLECGFPAASQYDFQIVQAIAKDMAAEQSDMIIAGLCQLREEQVVQSMEALQARSSKGKARIHIYVPVDPNLMQASLGMLANDHFKIIDDVYRLVKLAVQAGFEVEFSPEGYSRMRTHFAFITDVIRAAVNAGAKVINCPDTIGGAARWQGDDYFVRNMQLHADIIKQEFPKQDIIWSTHCHNDLGLALDNTMEAVVSGPARQIEGCINGVGERAGNVSLEQCIMVIDQFGQQAHQDFEFFTNVNIEKLCEVSDFVAERMLARQPHSPITGENAARHSSGGHTNAIIKNPMAYQPFDPKRVGKEVSFVFGPLSGSNHAKEILEKNGFNCLSEDKVNIAQALKEKYSQRRKGITDEEVIAGFKVYCSPIKIEHIDYSKLDSGKTVLHMQGQFFDKKELIVSWVGENSALSALDSAVKKYMSEIEVIDYRSNACAGNNVDAMCNSTITVSLDNKNQYIGKAIDADINIAAIKAYIDAANQAYVNRHYRKEEAQHA